MIISIKSGKKEIFGTLVVLLFPPLTCKEPFKIQIHTNIPNWHFYTKMLLIIWIDNTETLLFFIIILSAVRVHLVLRPLLVYFEVIGGTEIGRGNRSTCRKAAPVSLCPPQIPHNLTRAQTKAAAVGSRRVTVWAMARRNAEISTK
jgi:hypothetical protein